MIAGLWWLISIYCYLVFWLISLSEFEMLAITLKNAQVVTDIGNRNSDSKNSDQS